MKKIVGVCLVGLFILFQVYLFFIKQFPVLAYERYINESPLPLGDERTVISQEFYTPGPLARMDIMLANYLHSPKGGLLRLTLFQKQKRVFLKNFPAHKVEDNRFYSFSLQREKTTDIIPSGHYVAQLDYFPQDPKDKLAVWITNKNVYPHGGLLVNNQRQDGDMTFRIYYWATLWATKNRWLFTTSVLPGQQAVLIGSLVIVLLILNYWFFYVLRLVMVSANRE